MSGDNSGKPLWAYQRRTGHFLDTNHTGAPNIVMIKGMNKATQADKADIAATSPGRFGSLHTSCATDAQRLANQLLMKSVSTIA